MTTRLLNWLLSWLDLKVVYESEFGLHEQRYDALDRQMCRPIHKDMRVAPPWARMRIVARGTEAK